MSSGLQTLPGLLLALTLGLPAIPMAAAEAQRGAGRALTAIRAAEEHGLRPSDYGLARLEHLLRTDTSRVDSTLASSLTHLAQDLRFGRVRPNAYSNLRESERLDLAAAVRTALAADTVPELMEAMAPPTALYRSLRQALAHAGSDASDHARKIQLTMERLRWLPRPEHERVVLVNIPAFELNAFDTPDLAGNPALTMRVIVGRASRTRTPLLGAMLRTVEFRPFWNVPRSILVGELLPAMRKNARYLIEHDMEIVGPRDSILGDKLDQDLLDRLGRGEVRVRQRPTERNALGAVKLEFPNPSSIFLHDTPDKRLFARERRDLSHGCIRLERPGALASWALAERPGWAQDSTDRAMSDAARRILAVAKPTMVILFYGTADALPDGTLRFHPDLYGLDRQLTTALSRTR